MTNKDAFMEYVSKTLETAMKLKAKMLERSLTSAKTNCPHCDGFLYMRLVGRKNHAHFSCDKCGAQGME